MAVTAQSNFLKQFNQRAKNRREERIKNRKNINLNFNSNDILATKAMVLIAMSVFNNILDDIKRHLDDFKQDKKEQIAEIISEIEKARNEGKDLNLELLNTKEFQEKLREFDKEKFDENLKELKQQVESGEKYYRFENLFINNSDTVNVDTKTATQKQANTTQKQR